jgi:hypothetical protein
MHPCLHRSITQVSRPRWPSCAGVEPSLRDGVRPGGAVPARRIVQPPLGAVPTGQHDRGENPTSSTDSVRDAP